MAELPVFAREDHVAMSAALLHLGVPGDTDTAILRLLGILQKYHLRPEDIVSGFFCSADNAGLVCKIPIAERERLKAVFARLGSSHPGEAAAASGAITRILGRFGMGPEDLVPQASAALQVDEAPNLQDILHDIDEAMKQGMDVSAWEVIFIRQLRNSSRVSAKQVEILTQIHDRTLSSQA